jgi:hypothetical protein
MAATNKPGQSAGDADRANAAGGSTEQVTQTGDTVPAEGAQIAKEVEKENEARDVVTLADTTPFDKDTVTYDEDGVLVNKDGKRVALSADALDPDVGWTAQHAQAHQKKKDRVAYPGGPASTPDQTVHPDELPDPTAALRAGLLPQNAGVLNIDPAKFEGKKSLEA